ncbi:hypothetical protein GCM10011612_14700 [Actinomyces gaoshouyii]|uniref:Uncharacterized protein n=1 Tax=Actinomyces gaoshouyii TaxID=1960083 RepID=A0A8H9LJ03_9ACTO|nr:hypothetical protein GCM10011612_14700 [Actinomyces gaoshouyii]
MCEESGTRGRLSGALAGGVGSGRYSLPHGTGTQRGRWKQRWRGQGPEERATAPRGFGAFLGSRGWKRARARLVIPVAGILLEAAGPISREQRGRARRVPL